MVSLDGYGLKGIFGEGLTMKKKGPNEETKIQRECLDALATLPGAFPLRFANMGRYDNVTKKWVKVTGKYSPRGVSDIFLFYNNSFYAIEVKTPKAYEYIASNFDRLNKGIVKKKPGDEVIIAQINFIRRIRNCGHGGFFTMSANHCLKMVNNYEDGKKI